MARSVGIGAVKKWQAQLPRSIVRVTLCAETMSSTEGEQIAEWEEDGTDAEPGFRDKEWPETAMELAQEDCNARAQSMRYSVRSYGAEDSRPRSRTHMTLVCAQLERGDDKPQLDGSPTSVIAQLQKGQEGALRMLFDFVKLEAAQKAATNQLITQLSLRLREQEEMIGKLVDTRTAEQIQHGQTLATLAEKNAEPKRDNEEFMKFAEMALPHVVPVLMEKAGPMILRVMSALVPTETAPATVAATETAATVVDAAAAVITKN